MSPAHPSVSFFFWLVAAWVKSRAERPSVSGVNKQLHGQVGCKLVIRNRKDELTKQAKRNKLLIRPEGPPLGFYLLCHPVPCCSKYAIKDALL